VALGVRIHDQRAAILGAVETAGRGGGRGDEVEKMGVGEVVRVVCVCVGEDALL
jgi:hypothetical protein